ncbi:YdcF family protein [Sphingomonas jatrophae]|uniref:Uncharacterized SAM-binding protein YcdF, DUF218 family n=1 Tax=Sphingomonas jatrophae TaxID=1166337 RepID=A0A1I6LNP1_9SPHN|nr:YdcF family protein [Sphingomonas jatrophae]SFS04900.1 Uncharacterized SAM-binding protein YcdF, DUF218 family [Sphingomonas jatrophae]
MIARAASVLLLLWLLGFALFAVTIPGPAPDGERTDGVVAVTGGAGRVARGLALVQAGAARRLLVSGADRRVRKADLAAEYRVPARLIACCVDLGQESVDTRSNGDETARWIAARGYRSIRLVTTDWHMARAHYELGRALPAGVTVLPDAVPSEPGLMTLIAEYNKYLLRRVAAPLGY